MFRRVFLGAVLLGAACGSGDVEPADQSGRLVLRRGSPADPAMLDMPAIARYCERDSTLSIVAVGDAWSGALAMRSAWPILHETRFAVAAPLGEVGSGAAAARPLADSAQVAFIGTSGAITVTPGSLLAGTVDAGMASDSAVTARLIGRFEGLVVRTGVCP